METIIHEDSPLAEYLEGTPTPGPHRLMDIAPPTVLGLNVRVGEGRAGMAHAWIEGSSQLPRRPSQSFAPRGLPMLHTRVRETFLRPLRLGIPQNGLVARIHSACSRVANSTLGRADNARFLEHFRYIIVASQLLNEHPGQSTFKGLAMRPPTPSGTTITANYQVVSTSLTGAAVTALTAFALVWLIHWARGSLQSGFSRGRWLLVLTAFTIVATLLYTHARRQWLQYLRQQAIDGASMIVARTQVFEASTTSALTLIQEVELVSRGYRLTPLPPITRLDDRGQSRRCSRLRKNLRKSFATAIPAFAEACSALHVLLDEDDIEKYFDIYDISNQDLREAALGCPEIEDDDVDSLKVLRVLQYRLSTLRRVVMCSLLALEADGGKPDFHRWRMAVEIMNQLSTVMVMSSEKLGSVLNEEERFTIPPTPRTPSTPGRERLRSQVRKLSSLSQGIRCLQAKMQILREESNRTLEESEDVSELGSSLMSQYESIGVDLQSLTQAWEAGKASLAINIDKHERRISHASNGLQSPAPSLGGLTVVEEDGSPADALRALNGECPSNRSSMTASASDEEIYEAIAIPKQRSTFSREERIAKMQEERVRQASLRKKRDATTDMLKELESVISTRPQRPNAGRITSV
ncbi:Mysoin-binding motif of peroxisomes-domain-containing protein [Cryomyces antarcticus]